MKAKIIFEIDTDELPSITDSYLAALWHIAQANPVNPFKDREAGQLAECVGREIIRRFVAGTSPELWHHQGGHFDWAQRSLDNSAA